MANGKAVSVPPDPHAALLPTGEDDRKLSNVPYREAVGLLVFLAAVSRPDIAFAVNSVSKYLGNHNETHWRAVKRIFAYLQGTIDYGIKYESGGSEAMLIGFSDADYAGDIETRRSTTGYVFCLAGGAVTWSSQ
ncbi:secreted RxLR effector protein 161-like [Osmia bicornis bicornis]|uniref:secreted RxLR effector protein 161-like n=1 Tax=Osmia bicornis bicornis TaxID=1437191 RepID=UPI001EAF4CA0|nr:secreted RxLR effector protein 161-like [Osmia bicornis bicornis]